MRAPGRADFTVVSYPDLRHVPLTPFQLISSRYPRPGEIVTEFGDTGLQHVGLGDYVTLDTARGTQKLRVVGIARTPGLNPATSGMALGYMSEAGLAALPVFTYVRGPAARRPLRTEQIAVGLRAPGAYQATVSALTPVIAAHGGTILAVLPPQNGVARCRASVIRLRACPGPRRCLPVSVTGARTPAPSWRGLPPGPDRPAGQGSPGSWRGQRSSG